MKKKLALVLALVFAMSLTLVGCGGGGEEAAPSASAAPSESAAPSASGGDSESAPPADGTVYNIRIATWDSAATPSGGSIQEAADKMNEMGGGRINAEAYLAETLLTSTDSLTGVAQGLADITFWQVDLVAGTTPLASMLTLPFTQDMPKSAPMTAALRELVLPEDSPFQKEMEAMNLRWVDVKVPDGMSIHLVDDKPVYVFNDLQGLKLIGVAEMQDYVAMGGGNIVNMPAGDFYTSLEKGVVDGSLHHMALVKIFAENELTKSHTLYGTNDGLHTCAVGFVANNEFWNSLPADIQDIVTQCLTEQEDFMIESDINDVAALVQTLEEDGQPIYNVEEDQLQTWYDAGSQFVNDWLDSHQDQFPDVNLHELYDQYMALCEAHVND